MHIQTRTAAAAMLALLATATHVQAQLLPPPPTPPAPRASLTEFIYSATVSDAGSDTSVNQNNLDRSVINGRSGTPGLVTVNNGPGQATVWALADPASGMFKSFAQAVVTENNPTTYAAAVTSMSVLDTLRFTGTGSTADVVLTLNWNTVISGLNGVLLHPDLSYWYGQVVSRMNVGVSWEAPNPGFNPGYECNGSLDELCQPATIRTGASGGNELIGVYEYAGPGASVRGGVRDGTYTDSFSLALNVPVDTDIRITYDVYNEVACFYVNACALTVDASHSDYIGLKTAPGVSFTSAGHLRYEGLAAAVPEPGTWALSLLGLAGLALRRRAAGAVKA